MGNFILFLLLIVVTIGVFDYIMNDVEDGMF